MPTNDITGVPDDWQSQFMNWLRAGGGAQPRSSVTNPLAAAASIPTTGVPPAQAPSPVAALIAQQPYYPSAQGGMPFPQNPGPAASNMPYPGQIDPRGYFAPRAAPAATAAPAGTATAAPAAPRSVAPTPVVHTPGAPNLGYYPPNPRFGVMQSQVPSGRGPLGNNPIYTTMNLFGGGQQPAAAPPAAAPAPAPAPVPAPVPAPAPGNVTSNAPWPYGPQQRNIGWPSNTPYGPDWRDLAASRSGYQ
jgi:hypothetical protein